MALLFATPAMIALAAFNRGLLLGCSVALWLVAGIWELDMPNWPTPGGWFLDPFSWQLVYAIGLLAGMSSKKGKALVPYDRLLFAGAAAFLVYALVVVRFELWSFATDESLPKILGGFDKTYLSLQRLVHVLCMAYVVANIPAFARASSSAAATPINYLGRNSLPVFAAGSVICIALQVAKSVSPTSLPMDLVLLAAGIGLQYAAAAAGSFKIPAFSSGLRA
jgi:hypothetical protein